MELSQIAVGVGVVSGLVGTILGIWNRVAQHREIKFRLGDRTPHFVGVMSPYDGTWRRLTLRFTTPQGIGATIHSIELLSPWSGKLRWALPGKGSVPRTGRRIPVVWAFNGTAEPEKWRPEAKLQCNVIDRDVIRVRIHGREANAMKRPFTTEGEARFIDKILPGNYRAGDPVMG